MEQIVSCQVCGLVQRIEPLPRRMRWLCARCHFEIRRRKRDSATRTLALAIGALALYIPANLLPIVQVEYWGAESTTTIFDGVRGLFQTGSYVVGCLIFCTSILFPGLKIAGLILLSATVHRAGLERFRAWVYRMIQILDPWNMLEVTMLSIIVALAELGKVATVHPGAGVVSFAAVVVLTIAATLTFDPRLVWDAREEQPS
ncbi:MAG TPA: paraquat-inducible protein A [Phycisphaerae bacterium]|nr:paraquat-inducible protein A [Phycisphaerae bacterium]